jgi:hypothetical protein
MGQYHIPVCPDLAQAFMPHDVGCGLKSAEQLFTRPGTCAALVALVSARGGNMPADMSQSPLIGRWAGQRVLIQGDYAEDGDIPGWGGPPLSKLYAAFRDPEDEKPGTGQPIFADLSGEVTAFLEGACSVRFFKASWGSSYSVAVKPVAREFGGSGVAEYVIDTSYTADDLAFFKRVGMLPIDVQRSPRSGDWHGIRPNEVAEGQRRVIVNLDTREYLDPEKFGQVPTLAGMLAFRGPPPWPKAFEKADPGGIAAIDIAGALFTLLTHPERRGGGDIPNTREEALARGSKSVWRGGNSIQGRWRGCCVLGTSEIANGDPDWPTTDEVLSRGADISAIAIKHLVAVSHF